MVEIRFKPSLVGTVEDGAVTTVKLADEAVTNAKVKADAAIVKTKLAALAIVDADVDPSAGITKTKLAALEIVDADVNAAAAIAKSKLEALAIVDADVNTIGQAKVTDLVTDLAEKVAGTGTTGDKDITKIGWDSVTEEIIIDHEV